MLEHAEHLKRKMLFDVCDSYHRIHTVLQSLHETVVPTNYLALALDIESQLRRVHS